MNSNDLILSKGILQFWIIVGKLFHSHRIRLSSLGGLKWFSFSENRIVQKRRFKKSLSMCPRITIHESLCCTAATAATSPKVVVEWHMEWDIHSRIVCGKKYPLTWYIWQMRASGDVLNAKFCHYCYGHMRKCNKTQLAHSSIWLVGSSKDDDDGLLRHQHSVAGVSHISRFLLRWAWG